MVYVSHFSHFAQILHFTLKGGWRNTPRKAKKKKTGKRLWDEKWKCKA